MIVSAKKRIIEIPTRSCHAGTVARLNGKSFMAWFGGTRESADDVDIYYTHTTDEGLAEIKRVTANENIAHWNPVLLPRENGLDLFFKMGETIPDWQTMRARLDAEGNCIADPVELVPGDFGGRGPVKNKCLKLKSGRILAPASLETKDPDRWDAYIDISDDGGETFTEFVPIPLYRKGTTAWTGKRWKMARPLPRYSGEENEPDRPWCRAENAGIIQPTLWQTADGAVHALLRSSEGYILRSNSYDEGMTWCPAYNTGMPNNNSGIDLTRLHDGRIFLCANPVGDNWGARSPLTLFVSQDDGETFTELMKLEMLPGEYSYPGIVAEGNKLFIIYTWNRRKMAYWEIELEERR